MTNLNNEPVISVRHMSTPITLKLRRKDDQTDLEVRVQHPMEPGRWVSEAAKSLRQPSFLQLITIQLNDKTLVEGQLSASLSKNPRFGFSFSGVKTGDRFTVSFTDNKGSELKSEIVAGPDRA